MNNYGDYQDHQELSAPPSTSNYPSGYQPGQQNGDNYMYQNGEGSVTEGDYNSQQNQDSYRLNTGNNPSDQDSYRQQTEDTTLRHEDRTASYRQDTERQPDLYASNHSQRASREQLQASREQLRASKDQLQSEGYDIMRSNGDPLLGSRNQLDRQKNLGSNPNFQDGGFYSDQGIKPQPQENSR